MTLFSKGDKILIKNLYKCKGYNARQFITKFLSKAWTKNSINMLLLKFGTVDRRLGSGRCRAHTDKNVDTVESLLLSQEDKAQSRRIVREISAIISFADCEKRSASQLETLKLLQEKARSTAD